MSAIQSIDFVIIGLGLKDGAKVNALDGDSTAGMERLYPEDWKGVGDPAHQGPFRKRPRRR